MKRKSKVFVAMSGGVDSSVAALLLKEQGYEIIGVFMRCYNVDGCAEKDAEDARRVAGKLGIPFYVWDFENEYKERVVNYMIDGYRRGITPNPDVMCNREIKFGLFLEKALEMGADYVATGHYVRLKRGSLLEARDKNKDQSYFLWTLKPDRLRHCLFPIGDYLKSEVRELARKAGLPTADKKDSQGICFLGKVTLADFLRQYLPEKRGLVLTASGEKIGEHRGSFYYTIGQRHGLGIAGRLPYYVAEKNIGENTLVVAEGKDNSALYQKELELTDANFTRPLLSLIRANGGIRVLARVRYRQPLAPAVIHKSDSGIYKLIFDSPQKFVAAGQSAVFYGEKGELLGGGIIV